MKRFNSSRIWCGITIFLVGTLMVPLVAQVAGVSDRFAPVAAGLEAYAVDNNGKYPPHKNPTDTNYQYYLPDLLTTPIAYMEPHQMNDPFASLGRSYNRYRYFNTVDAFGNTLMYQQTYVAHGAWAVWSVGPGRAGGGTSLSNPVVYDATNGTISSGVIIRNQRMLKETGAE